MTKTINHKTQQRLRRRQRIRAKVTGSAKRPRLTVFRSNRYIYAMLVDDATGRTLAAASDIKATSGPKTERAGAVGENLAKAAAGKKITQVVFDRGGYLFTGRVKALATAARAGGLEF